MGALTPSEHAGTDACETPTESEPAGALEEQVETARDETPMAVPPSDTAIAATITALRRRRLAYLGREQLRASAELREVQATGAQLHQTSPEADAPRSPDETFSIERREALAVEAAFVEELTCIREDASNIRRELQDDMN